MANDQSIDIVIKAVDDATATLKKVQGEVDNLSKKMSEASKSAAKASGGISSSFGSIGKSVMAAVTAVGLFEWTKALLTLTSQVEQSKISFETLLGSQEKVVAMMRDIDEMAAKTPFEKQNLTPLVQQLIGMGFEAEKTLPIIQVLGDSMSALGRGQDDLNGVVLALGQIQTKGKLSAEELMQMAERGLPVFSILEQKLWLTKKQLENIGNVGISSATGINALLTGLNEKFAGSMAKQAQTLAGQFSNLKDNVNSTLAAAGANINEKVKWWLASVNKFFESNKPIIMKFAADVLNMMVGVGESIAEVFSIVFDIVSQVMIWITGQTNASASSQMKSWQAVFMVVANWVNGVALIVGNAIHILFGAAKVIWVAIRTTIVTVVSGIMGMLSVLMKPLQDTINLVIDGLNLILKVMGRTAIEWVKFATTLGQEAATMLKESWTQWGEDIEAAWTTASEGMQKTTQTVVTNMVSNMERYQTSVWETANTQSDLWARTKKTLDDMAGSLKWLAGAQWSAKDAAWAHNKELKAMQEKAEDAIKPIIDKIKETKKEIDDARKKIKETTDEWKKYRTEWLKSLSDVNMEIAKLKKEAGDINLKINSEQTNKLGERYVEILKEQKTAEEDLKTAQKWDSNGMVNAEWVTESQKRITDLAKERLLIENGINKSQLESAVAYDSMSQSEKIILDSQKERNTQLSENTSKMQAALEKQQILEAQTQQKKLGELSVFSEFKDGILTASVELEKGKRVEIHDAENIALAADIAQKQLAYKTDFVQLTQTLNSKLSAQQQNLQQTATLYKQFNTFLKDDTKKTADAMVAMIQSVNIQLREMISLRAQAGVTGSIAGARANGGPIDAGKPYLVWENGPEIVIPKSSGTVIPNSGLANGTQTNNITINIPTTGARTPEEQASLAKVVSQELARQLQLYRLGIAT